MPGRRRQSQQSRDRARERSVPEGERAWLRILREGERLLEVDNPLHAELFGSEVLGSEPGSISESGGSSQIATLRLVKELQRRGGRVSLAVLAALATVAPNPLAGAVESARTVLREAAFDEPQWVAHPLVARFADAYLGADPEHDQDLVFVGFTRPPHPAHGLFFLADPATGAFRDGRVVALEGPFLDSWRESSEVEMHPIDEATVAGLIDRGLAAMEGAGSGSPRRPSWTRGLASLRALALARRALLIAPSTATSTPA